MVNLTVVPRTVEGDSWRITADHQDTLQTLGEKLEEFTGYPADYMYFFHDRKGLLERNRTFEDYNIRPESRVELLLRFGGKEPLGGLPVPDPIPWYNEPVPDLITRKGGQSREAFFGNMLYKLEAQFARQMGYPPPVREGNEELEEEEEEEDGEE